jgi:hypothetical protein
LFQFIGDKAERLNVTAFFCFNCSAYLFHNFTLTHIFVMICGHQVVEEEMEDGNIFDFSIYLNFVNFLFCKVFKFTLH